MTAFSGQNIVLTGAASGIGRSLAEAFLRAGACLAVIVRSPKTLPATIGSALADANHRVYKLDLEDVEATATTAASIRNDWGRVDVLVHCAGTVSLGRFNDATAEDFDRQYRVNVRAPWLLTRELLPAIPSKQGQVVFINSSAGVVARAGVGQYAATKHALKALADSLRDEVNSLGIRVVTLFPGRTATPMQEKIHEAESKRFEQHCLIQPSDIADVVLHTLSLPRTVELTDIHLRPSLGPAIQSKVLPSNFPH
ncbi:MAG TPA: SDR family NAD(P)-dependent oxidoreductase [Chthoniobacterales bacterium]